MANHEVKITKQSSGYFIARCQHPQCGWTYGPDTEYQCGQQADEHQIQVARADD